MAFERAERLNQLPPYLFAEIDRLKDAAIAAGRDVIDLGVGDPDQATPDFIIERLSQAAKDRANHRYSLNLGMRRFRQAIASWYERRFGVVLDPDAEILPLIGSKEGIAHLPLGFVNPGAFVLCPDPGYPPYVSGAIFAAGIPYPVPLLEKNEYLPDLERIDKKILAKAKLMFLNYPNNPTSAVADRNFFAHLVNFGRDNDIIIAHDASYTEIAFDGFEPASFLASDGARKVGVEFHSLSKTFNMTGWRIGFACGNREVIAGLAQVKSNLDSGIFPAIQWAGIAALEDSPQAREHRKNLKALYQERRNVLVAGLNQLGWKVPYPKATFYVWVPVPAGYTSAELSQFLLEEADLVTTPGIGFGAEGEGYIRMALTVGVRRLEEAVKRIAELHRKRKGLSPTSR